MASASPSTSAICAAASRAAAVPPRRDERVDEERPRRLEREDDVARVARDVAPSDGRAGAAPCARCRRSRCRLANECFFSGGMMAAASVIAPPAPVMIQSAVATRHSGLPQDGLRAASRRAADR